MIRNVLMIAALAALIVSGCLEPDTKAESDQPTSPDSAMTSVSTSYCADCGHEGGEVHVCDTECQKCDCGMHKGSALCCVELPADMQGKEICACGFVKGSERCCDESAQRCEKCSMIAGSPLCCKVNTGEAHDHDEDHTPDHDGDSKGEGKGEGETGEN